MNCNGHEKQPVAARSKALMLEFCTGTMGTKLYVSLITKDLKLEIYFLSKHLPCFWRRASSCGCFGDKWIIGATRRKPQQWRVCDAVIFLSWRLSQLDWITARQTRPSVRPATFSTKALMCVMSSCNWCMQMSVGGQFAQLSNWVTMVIGGVCHFFDSLVGLPDKGFYFSLCNVVKTPTHWPSPRGLFTLLSSPHFILLDFTSTPNWHTSPITHILHWMTLTCSTWMWKTTKIAPKWTDSSYLMQLLCCVYLSAVIQWEWTEHLLAWTTQNK